MIQFISLYHLDTAIIWLFLTASFPFNPAALMYFYNIKPIKTNSRNQHSTQSKPLQQTNNLVVIQTALEPTTLVVAPVLVKIVSNHLMRHIK